MTPTCILCRYSRPQVIYDENEEILTPVLECWRYPPITIWAEDGLIAVRPEVAEDDTCGEYSR